MSQAVFWGKMLLVVNHQPPIFKRGCDALFFFSQEVQVDQILSMGSRESFTWIILKTILCLVLDSQGNPNLGPILEDLTHEMEGQSLHKKGQWGSRYVNIYIYIERERLYRLYTYIDLFPEPLNVLYFLSFLFCWGGG